MFDDEYVGKLPNDPLLAGKRVCDDFVLFYERTPGHKHKENYEIYL
jgi:hypothetical protein